MKYSHHGYEYSTHIRLCEILIALTQQGLNDRIMQVCTICHANGVISEIVTTYCEDDGIITCQTCGVIEGGFESISENAFKELIGDEDQ